MSFRVEAIAVGSELLQGETPERNIQLLGRMLQAHGVSLRYAHVVGDQEADLDGLLGEALGRANLVFLTGGLGPTEDDITRRAVARVCGRRLVLQDEALQQIRTRFQAVGLPMPASNEKQALVPFGARVLENPLGTAPGFVLTRPRLPDGQEGATLVALPGVPGELRVMLDGAVADLVASLAGEREHVVSRVLRSCGLAEARVGEILKDLMAPEQNPRVGLLASEMGVDVRLVARGETAEAVQETLAGAERRIRARLENRIYGTGGETLEAVVGRLLSRAGWTLAVAESCTGGLITHRITNVPGSSAYFERGVVSYSDKAKVELLKVSKATLKRHGAVSPETALAMAHGIHKLARTDLGLSVTGIAGPSGGTEQKPVGLVYMALATSKQETVQEQRFMGDREAVKQLTSQAALDLVRRCLQGSVR